MHDTAKYLVHADITADGVVERSDVVGAVFGQTEGLLGDELDLRDLQDSSKVGRIDVDVESQNGQSFGRITIATSLDQVETAILGAALETIDRVGPCRSTIEVRRIEDVRAAKRREVVERAKTLLAEAFDDSLRSSRDLVEEVREAVRVEDITEYRSLPAGPNVADSDAVVVVEGRADVQTLLRYGIKNAVAVEGTNVPDAVAELTDSRTVTAFLDGDRGGELILKELAQVGSVDHVAFAPEGRSVEDLERKEALVALREKVPYDRVRDAEEPSAVATTDVTGAGAPGSAVGATDGPGGPPGGAAPDAGRNGADGTGTPTGADRTAGAGSPAAPDGVVGSGDGVDGSTTGGRDGARPDEAGASTGPAADASSTPGDVPDPSVDADGRASPGAGSSEAPSSEAPSSETASGEEVTPAVQQDEPATADADVGAAEGQAAESHGPDGREPETLRGHVREVVGDGTGTVRLLDAEFGVLERGPVEETFDLLADGPEGVATVVLDGELDQRLLDVAAQRGIGQVVAATTGEFVKQPTSVRVRTGEELLTTNEA